jgi:hypothetical protein
MSFNICRGTLGGLAMFTAMRNASSYVAADRGQFSAMRNVAYWPLATDRQVAIAVANGGRTDIGPGCSK